MCPVPSKLMQTEEYHSLSSNQIFVDSSTQNTLLPTELSIAELAPIELNRPTPHREETPTHSPNVPTLLDHGHGAKPQCHVNMDTLQDTIPACLQTKKGTWLAHCH